jgi:hypothetical protein
MAAAGLIGAVGRWLQPLRPRLIPGLVVVGAQKAGTSALFTMLASHPKVVPPRIKELDFFGNDAHYAEGFRWYKRLLPARPLRGDGYLTLEATPNYLSHPLAAQRIKEHLGDVLIAVILRDPVRRAHSDWNMFHQFKDHHKYAHLYDPRSFEQAVEEELAAAAPVTHYVDRGYYAEQVERYFDVFGRHRVMVYSYPQFKRDAASVYTSIEQAAGLPPRTATQAPRRTKANVRAYEMPLGDAVRQRLTEHFRQHRAALDALLGRPIDLDEESSTADRVT